MARVRLPILVTSSKLLAVDGGDIVDGGTAGNPFIDGKVDGSVLDVVPNAVLTFADRIDPEAVVDVYAAETGGTPIGDEEKPVPLMSSA